MFNYTPESLSFSKKPIFVTKRHSVISECLSSGNDNDNDQDSGSNYTLAKLKQNRTFSEASELISAGGGGAHDVQGSADVDDLDYDEQIRAPKFKLAGCGPHDASRSGCGSSSGSGGSSKTSSNALVRPEAIQTEKRKYQPAKVDISLNQSSSLPVESATSSSLLINNLYPIEQYLLNCSAGESSAENPGTSSKPLRTISEPKQPNYIPCVLRPTTAVPGAPFPPLAEIPELNSTESTAESTNTPESSPTKQHPPQATVQHMSRAHWKANSSREACFSCDRLFSLINRRHHCRKCGEIFCYQCANFKSGLDVNCEFSSTNGQMVKVCFNCYNQWKLFLAGEKVPTFKQLRARAHNDPADPAAARKDDDSVLTDWFQSSF